MARATENRGSYDPTTGTTLVSGSVTANPTGASAGAVTTVAASATAVSLLAANADRKQARVVNDSSSVLYVALGETASATNYTAKLNADEAFNFDGYTGAVSGIWVSATGNARITELS